MHSGIISAGLTTSTQLHRVFARKPRLIDALLALCCLLCCLLCADGQGAHTAGANYLKLSNYVRISVTGARSSIAPHSHTTDNTCRQRSEPRRKRQTRRIVELLALWFLKIKQKKFHNGRDQAHGGMRWLTLSHVHRWHVCLD